MDGACLLVADAEFIKHIKSRGVSGDLVMRDSASYQGKVPSSIQNVLVFCRKGELTLIRRLQNKYPDKTIISGTYEFSVLRADGLPTLDNVNGSYPQDGEPPIVILSAPYGAADYLGHLISDATGIDFVEHLGRPMLNWIRLAEDFQVSRFFANAACGSSPDKPFATVLLADVVDAALNCTNLSQERLVRTLNSSKAKVLLLRHPPRFDHAFSSALLERSRLRFCAQASAGKPHPVNPSKVTMMAALRWAQTLGHQEALVTAIGDGLDTVLEIDAEDLLSCPGEQLASVTDFLGLGATNNGSVTSYTDYARPVDELEKTTMPMKRQLIDQLGLHLT